MSVTDSQFWRHPYFRHTLSLIILIVFVCLVEYFMGWRTVLHPWQTQAWESIFLAIFLAFITLLIRSARLYDYFHTQLQGRFPISCKLVIQHNFYNNILPMRAGELSFPILMSRYFRISSSQSLPALFWFRVLDLHTILTLGILAIGLQWWPTSLVTLALILWLPLPLALAKANQWLIRKWDGDKDHRLLSRLQEAIQNLPTEFGFILRSWLWTWANWAIKLGVYAWIITLFIQSDVSPALAGAISGDLTSILPVHGVAGSGTFEAGVVSGLLVFGISADQALLAAVNLHLFILAATFISAALSLLIPTGITETSRTNGS